MKNAIWTDPAPEPWVSIDTVAAHVGVTKDSIYRWIESRGLPATKVGKLWKLKLSEVDAWMRQGDNNDRAPELDAGRTTPTFASRLVLVVDDEKLVRDTVCDFVTDQGHEVQVAADGTEAMALLARGGRLPDLVILDLTMPGRDGWDFRELQLQDPRLAAIPVIVVTAVREAQIDGAIVLRKPLRLDALASAMATHLSAKEKVDP